MTEFLGKVLIPCTIEAITGLHIGGAPAQYEIGGVDNPVIKDPLGRPYIPGSSLRGKLRSLRERLDGRAPTFGRQSKFHVCQTAEEYEQCDVCQIFGVPAQGFNRISRLTVRDAHLDVASVEPMAEFIELPFTEVKYENTIDRITSQANPRQMERVPAGARFHGELVFTALTVADRRRLKLVLETMRLLEDDYLGGSGGRGSGQIAFVNLRVVYRPRRYYLGQVEHEEVLVERADSVDSLLDSFETWSAPMKESD